MKRLLLYVHYNKYSQLSEHVIYQLREMRSLFSTIIFISNSHLSIKSFEYLKEEQLIDDFIQRENRGFDFAAWHDGMKHLGFDKLSNYDSITTMNDTCFGPLYDMKPYYDKYEQDQSIDFWGLTNHIAYKEFDEHIQSYFISFKKKVIQSEVFLNFWRNIELTDDVQIIINNYETKLTSILLKAGFNYDTVLNTKNKTFIETQTPDFSYWRPDIILDGRVPFIKIKTIALRQDIASYVIDYINSHSNYPIQLLIKHMSTIDLPDYPYLLAHKYIDKKLIFEGTDSLIAIHLHVFYVDLLESFLDYFLKFNFYFDLFITTNSEAKKSEIQNKLANYQFNVDIILVENKGRDIYPMLQIKEYLIKYDFIGHFHTKKSAEADFFAGESWRKELIEMLIQPANEIIQNFVLDKRLGIVIADIPSFFRLNRIVDADNENQMAPMMNQLWHRMGLSKTIDFNQFSTFTMSYGTFMWVRTEAILPLFHLEIESSEIPEEPLPQNSILHAIERILIYIAWDGDFDFKISQNKILTPFIDNKLLNKRIAPQIKAAIKQQIITPRYVWQLFKQSVKRFLLKLKNN